MPVRSLAVLVAAGVLATSGPVYGAEGTDAEKPLTSTSSSPAQLVAQPTALAARVHSDRRPSGAGVYDPVANKTFVSWMGKGSDAFVQEYDHATGTWSDPMNVGSSFPDKHNYPVMVQADDGRLLVFHGAHNSALQLSVSPSPHTIAGSWSQRSLGDVAPYYASYPMALKAGNGDIYVFFRDTLKEDDPTKFVDDRPMQYLRSTDNGRSWVSSGELTGAPYAIGSDRDDNLDEVYMGEIVKEPSRNGRPERWHLVWTMAGGGPGNHGHGTIIRDFYYATFQPSNQRFSSVRGRDLGRHIDEQEMLRDTLVLQTDRNVPHGSYLTHPIEVLRDGSPVFLYHRRTPETDTLTAVRWTGGQWRQSPAPYDVGMLELERMGPMRLRVYATPRDGRTGIQLLELDGGTTWRLGQFVPTDQPLQKINVIDNARDPVRAIAEGSTGTQDQNVQTGNVYAVGEAP
jgi:hypothetical protein